MKIYLNIYKLRPEIYLILFQFSYFRDISPVIIYLLLSDFEFIWRLYYRSKNIKILF